MSNHTIRHQSGDRVPILLARPDDFAVGSLQSRAAARAMLSRCGDTTSKDAMVELGALTPFEIAITEDCKDATVRCLMIRLVRAGQESARLYGQELPMVTPQQIRRGRAVFKEVDQITGGKSSMLYAAHPAEWNRFKAIAEQNLRAKGK